MVDALLLANADVTALAGTANVNPLHLNPSPESAGYVYHIPVGTDLPTGWQTVTLRVPAHCAGSAQIQQSPSFVVRRYATTGALTVKVAGGQPQWNRSGGKDTLSFVFKSNWAVSIHGLVIIDDGDDASTRGNKVTQAYPDDGVASTTHTITLKASVPLIGGRQYEYDVQFQAGDFAVTPSTPLPSINLPAVPTTEFVLVQFPNADQLTVKDKSKDFTFQAQTSDNGTLDAVFDILQINDSNTLHGTALADGLTHTFTIAKKDIPADQHYSFHFAGTRTATNQSLVGAHPSELVVATQTSLNGPIGLGLSKDNANIVVTYCLSQASSTVVRISNNPTNFSVEAPGNPIKDGTGDCPKGGPLPYTSTIPLSSFTGKVPETSTTQAAKPGAASPAGPVGASTPPQLPLQLYIVDTSSADRTLATLNIAAVLIPKGVDPTGLTKALTTLSDKKASVDDKSAATKALMDTYGLNQASIDSLTQISKKTNGAASTIGTVLGSLGKSFVTAYLGIPAAPATK
jgi:hypothetical protein